MNGPAQQRRSGLVHERAGGPTEWYTPPHIFTALGISFDLDPSSPGARLVPWIPARIHYTRSEDGLRQPWHGRVWLNPPYGRGIDGWLERFVAHRNGIALIFARTDTEWFHRFAVEADALCFTRGRIPFVSPMTSVTTGGPGCGSLLLAYGTQCVNALRQSGLGFVIEPRHHGRRPASRFRGQPVRRSARRVGSATRSRS